MIKRLNKGLLVIGDWYETMSLDTLATYGFIYKSCKAIEHLVVMLVNYCIFEKLNHLSITFDIDVNGGESDMEKHSM